MRCGLSPDGRHCQWECPRCQTIICGVQCKEIRMAAKLKEENCLQSNFPFPSKAFHTFNTADVSRHSEYNNPLWSKDHPLRVSDDCAYDSMNTSHLVRAFFWFGAYFEKSIVVFNERDFNGVQAPYIQDPGVPSNEVCHPKVRFSLV